MSLGHNPDQFGHYMAFPRLLLVLAGNSFPRGCYPGEEGGGGGGGEIPVGRYNTKDLLLLLLPLPTPPLGINIYRVSPYLCPNVIILIKLVLSILSYDS